MRGVPPRMGALFMASRRQFIKTVLLASGAVITDWGEIATAATSARANVRTGGLNFKDAHDILRDRKRTLAFPAPRSEVDCVIVGAGMSGLAAAWRLKKEGRSFIILDGEPVIGGAARAGEWRGQKYAMGSAYFVTNDGVFKEIYDDIKLTRTPTAEDALWYGPDEMFVDFWRDDVIAQLPIAAREQEGFKRFRDGLIKFDGLPEYPLTKASPEKIARYDNMTTREYLAQYNAPELTAWMNQYCLSSCGASVDEVNAYCFLNFYSGEFGSSFDLPRYTFPGGMVGLSEQFKKHLGRSAMKTDCLVLGVENVGTGVVVRYIDAHGQTASVRGRTAILATQKRITHNLVLGMPREQNDLCAQVRYAPYITVNLLCSRPMFPQRAFDVWMNHPGLIFTDMVDGSQVGDALAGKEGRTTGPFTYCVYVPRPESERKNFQEPENLVKIAQQVADQLEHVYPGSRDAIAEMHVFAFGHTMVIPWLGSHTLFHPAVSRPVGNIHFANTDNDLSPSVESAIANGHDVAETVLGIMAG